jgi:hypothetical protein
VRFLHTPVLLFFRFRSCDKLAKTASSGGISGAEVEHLVRDDGVAGSNPATPTSFLRSRSRHGERYGERYSPVTSKPDDWRRQSPHSGDFRRRIVDSEASALRAGFGNAGSFGGDTLRLLSEQRAVGVRQSNLQLGPLGATHPGAGQARRSRIHADIAARRSRANSGHRTRRSRMSHAGNPTRQKRGLFISTAIEISVDTCSVEEYPGRLEALFGCDPDAGCA